MISITLFIQGKRSEEPGILSVDGKVIDVDSREVQKYYDKLINLDLYKNIPLETDKEYIHLYKLKRKKKLIFFIRIIKRRMRETVLFVLWH